MVAIDDLLKTVDKLKCEINSLRNIIGDERILEELHSVQSQLINAQNKIVEIEIEYQEEIAELKKKWQSKEYDYIKTATAQNSIISSYQVKIMEMEKEGYKLKTQMKRGKP